MSRGEAEARFTGAVSFPNSGDSRRFVSELNEFLESCSRVFFEIEKNPMYHHTLLGHAKALAELSDNFELNAQYFELPDSQRRCRTAQDELRAHVNDLERVLLELRPVANRWSLAQAERIGLSVKGILGTLKNLLDYNESDVVTVTSQNIALCRKAAGALETATAHIPKHKSNLINVTDALKEQVSNRATIVKDSSTRGQLEDLRRQLDPAVDICLNRGTTEDFANLRKLLDIADGLFRPQFSEGDFSYKDVDSAAFNSAIDDLLNAIKRGEGQGIRDNAGRLGAQAKALNDAGAALKEQTKQLVAAAADALRNKDSEDAQKRLEELMAQAKRQAEELAAQQKREAERRQQLLKASASVGLAIDSMQGQVGQYRETVRHPMTAQLERAMDEDEQRRIESLKK